MRLLEYNRSKDGLLAVAAQHPVVQQHSAANAATMRATAAVLANVAATAQDRTCWHDADPRFACCEAVPLAMEACYSNLSAAADMRIVKA